MKTGIRMIALVLVLLTVVSLASMFMGCGLLDSGSGSSGGRQKKAICNYCGGSGRVDGETCPWCNGRGYTYDNYLNDVLGE